MLLNDYETKRTVGADVNFYLICQKDSSPTTSINYEYNNNDYLN